MKWNKLVEISGISLFKQVTSETWFRATSMCGYSLGVCSKVEWLESTMGDKWAVGSKQGSRDILYVCNSSCRYEGAELCSALMVWKIFQIHEGVDREPVKVLRKELGCFVWWCSQLCFGPILLWDMCARL